MFYLEADHVLQLVSSTVKRNGMIPIDVKNSCFTERILPFGVVYRNTQPVLCTNSKLIWCHMKTMSWNGGADNQAPVCRPGNERSRVDAVTQAGFTLRPRNFSLSRACWIVFCEQFEMSSYFGIKILKNLAVFLSSHRLFFKQDLPRREHHQCMMLYTGLRIGEHPTLIGL